VARFQAYLAAAPDDRADPALAAAWDDFCLAYGPMVLALAAGWAGLEPDDAGQDAWAALLDSLPDYRPDPSRGPFLAWATVVVRNALANVARRQAASDRTPPSLPGPEPVDPSEAIERAEQVARVRRGLVAFCAESCPMACLAVVLHWYMGRTVEEVAARLGQSCGQVRGILYRVLPRLRALLADAIDPD
jgi:RNA polymerase sigma factor (sigma-70 family)